MSQDTDKHLKSISRSLEKIEKHLRPQKEESTDASDGEPVYREDG